MQGKDKALFKLTINNDLFVESAMVYSNEFHKAESLTSVSLTEILHPDYQSCIPLALAGLKEGETLADHILLGRIDGRYYYLRMDVEYNNSEYILTFSESCYMQEPVVSSDCASLTSLTEDLLGIFYRTDRFGNLIYFSNKLTDVLGYCPDELIGGNLRREYFISSEKYDDIRDTMLLNGRLADVEISLKHKDGNILWLKISSAAVLDENGEYFGTAGYVKNITEQKNGIEELAHMRRLLELKQKELDSITVSMEYRVQSQVTKGRKAEESILYHARLAEMGEMVGSIAHQWRQPLSALMFIIEDIRDAYHFGELDVPYLDDAISECMSYIRFMSDTMDDFRNFFRPEPEKEQFNLTEKLIEVVKMQYGRFEVGAVNVDIKCDLTAVNGGIKDVLYIEYGKGIRVFYDKPLVDGGIVVYGYPNLFKQVIINLVNNSIDSIMEMRARGMLGVTDPGRICILVKVDDRKVNICIEDNGTGIDDKIMELIFEPEYTTKPKNQGTGIGLHMAKSIVEKSLNGKIRAGNSDIGAVFTITIPRAAFITKPV